MLRYPIFMGALGCAVALGCSSKKEEPQAVAMATEGAESSPAIADAPKAKADFESAPGIVVKGEAEFTPTQNGVLAKVTIENAPPGVHGIHVHQKGDCSDIPGKSMGEHFAPAGDPHGLPGQPAHHMGDMGNVAVNDQGKGELEIELKDTKLDEGPTLLLGKSLVLHEKEDIGTQKQPSGDSGTPIACAIIQPE